MILLAAFVAMAAPGPTVALTVNETPSVAFGVAWADASRIGVRATTLPVDWSHAEPRPGEFDMAWPKVADAFYTAAGAELGLVLRDLNTNKDERPADLREKPFDDPAVLARWTKMADAALAAMPKVRLSWICVGNEVDASLGADRKKIEAYARYLHGAIGHLRKRRPGVRIGTAVTFDGIRRHPEAYRPILDEGDVAMVNYYLMDGAKRAPKDQVPRDLTIMTQYADAKPLLLTEVGAPSGTIIGSSEAAQAEFVRTMLAEVRERKIPYVNFVWMHDVGDAAATGFTKYYGSTDAGFKDFLATLGLRGADGKPKPAWNALAEGLKVRPVSKKTGRTP